MEILQATVLRHELEAASTALEAERGLLEEARALRATSRSELVACQQALEQARADLAALQKNAAVSLKQQSDEVCAVTVERSQYVNY